MKKETVTIQDVAKAAGVSVATISRVLNQSPLVKEKTRVKVEETIKKMNYEPNYLGRELRRAETMRILMLTPSLKFPMLSRIYQGIEDTARQHGYNVIICSTSNARSKEEELLQLLKTRIVDGVIMCSTTLSAAELNELGNSYSIVQCSEWKQASNTCLVGIDNEKAAFELVHYLIGAGHKRIAMISSHNQNSSKLREKGYKRALEAAGLPFDTSLLKRGDYTYENAEELTLELLQQDNQPTAIFCINDIVAIGCINAAKKLGKRVPEDIAVTGFDDTKESIMAVPQITTIRQPQYELGSVSMEMLIRRINGEAKRGENVMLDHELIKRHSV